MSQSTARIPSINTDEYWLKYLKNGMYIEVPVSGHHKKYGMENSIHHCANALALRDLHIDMYDSKVERGGVHAYFNFKKEGKMDFILGLDLEAMEIAEKNDDGGYSNMKEEDIESSVVKMLYVGSKKMRIDTPEQRQKRREGQRLRRLEEQKLKFMDNGNDNEKIESKNDTQKIKNGKVDVKAHLRTKRRASRWAA